MTTFMFILWYVFVRSLHSYYAAMDYLLTRSWVKSTTPFLSILSTNYNWFLASFFINSSFLCYIWLLGPFSRLASYEVKGSDYPELPWSILLASATFWRVRASVHGALTRPISIAKTLYKRIFHGNIWRCQTLGT